MAVSAPNTDNLLNCSICLDEFKVPVSLPCGHTFCKECIENHWSKALQGKAAPPFMCPQCRKAYTVVPPLHKNVVIDDVVRDRRERRERRERRQSGDRRWSVELLSAFKQTLTDRERVTTALSSSLLDKLGAAEEAAECFKRRLSASYDDFLRLVAEDHELALRAVDAERDAKLSAIRHELGRCTEVLGGLRETLSRIGELEATRDDAEFLQGLNDNWQRFMNLLNEHLEQPPSVSVEFATAYQLQQRIDELLSLFTASRRAAPSLPETPRAAEAAEGTPGGGGAVSLPSPATLLAPSPALTPAPLPTPFPAPLPSPLPSPSSAPLPAPIPSQSSAPLPSPSSAPLPSSSPAPTTAPSPAMLSAMQEPEPAPPRPTTAAPGHSAWSDVSLVRPNRAELIRRYGRSPCLNPDSAHRWLWVSENRRTVMMNLNQKQPDWPDRFESHQQVLGSDGFSSGRHYWEVDVGKAKWWRVGAAYGTIPRKGDANGYRLGENLESWCLHKQSSLTARHAGVENPVRTMATTHQRIGLYLDCEAGLLSFYGDTGGDVAELLHSFEHKFQQPLLPALELGGQFKGNSLSIAKLD
ncbi:E3 ubiquitin/ISG15 ligase TRIM25-like isoform X2 [Lampetra planeri]